jgi:hypothetical protein
MAEKEAGTDMDARRPRFFGSLWLLAAVVVGFGCTTSVSRHEESRPAWDVDQAEVIHWRASDGAFEQGFALEASGLAASRGHLFVPSEKYARLLILDQTADPRAQVIRLDVPRHSELEGIAIVGEKLLLCDEAHASVYEVSIGDDIRRAVDDTSGSWKATMLQFVDLEVRGGKIGFEGIEIGQDDGRMYVLLERSGSEKTGCVSRIYRFRRAGDTLIADLEPLDVTLADCAWRLTGLAWWEGRLIALRTQFPGERYEVVAVDLTTGAAEVVLELTEILRSMAALGWSNNVEGIAVTEDGSLWLVADNAVTGVIDDPFPPPGDDRTLLLRIPPTAGK